MKTPSKAASKSSTKPPAAPKPKLLDIYFDQGSPLKSVEKAVGDFPGAKVALVIEAGMTWAEVRGALAEIRKQFPS